LFVCLVPYSNMRFRFCLTLTAVMLVMLIFQMTFGTPVERRVELAVQEVIKENPEKAILAVTALSLAKTIPFWFTVILVVITGASEFVTYFLWRKVNESVSYIRVGLIGGVTCFLMIAGIGAQIVNWQMGIMGMEAQLAKLNRIEQEKLAKAEAELRELERQRQIVADSLEADKQRKKADLEHQQKVLEQEREKQRLEREKQQVEAEKQRQVKKEEQERERKEQEKKQAEEAERQRVEAERLRQEAMQQEKMRKDDLESRGLAYYPKPTTKYQGKTALEWSNWPASTPLKDARGKLKTPQTYAIEQQERLQQTCAALIALQEEGMPFLINSLGNQVTPQGADIFLRLIKIELVHYNDLDKIVACLDKKRSFIPTRMLALDYLRKRKESSKHTKTIEMLVKDLLSAPQHKAKVQESLDAINSAGDK
jgi:flagellar biosynthesis GTPase FlhF